MKICTWKCCIIFGSFMKRVLVKSTVHLEQQMLQVHSRGYNKVHGAYRP